MASPEERIETLRTEFEAKLASLTSKYDDEVVILKEANRELSKRLGETSRKLNEANRTTSSLQHSIEVVSSATPLAEALSRLRSKTVTLDEKKALVASEIGKEALKRLIAEDKKIDREPSTDVVDDVTIRELVLACGDLVLTGPSAVDTFTYQRKKNAEAVGTSSEQHELRKKANQRLDTIKPFTGGKGQWEEFVIRFRQAIENVNYTAADLKQAFIGKIEGDAFQILRGADREVESYGYEQLLDFFDRIYGKETKIQQLMNLFTTRQKPNESCLLFASRIKIQTKRLLKQQGMPEIRRITAGKESVLVQNPLMVEETYALGVVQLILEFIHVGIFCLGLRPEIRIRLRHSDYPTLSMAVDEATEHEEWLELNSPNGQLVNALNWHTEEETPAGQAMYMARSSSRSRDGNGKESPLRCWECGSENHLRQNCPRWKGESGYASSQSSRKSETQDRHDTSERRERRKSGSPNSGYQRSPSRGRPTQPGRSRRRSPERGQVKWSANSLDKKEKLQKIEKKREAIRRRMKKYSNALGALETKAAAMSDTDTDSDISSDTSFTTAESESSGNE